MVEQKAQLTGMLAGNSRLRLTTDQIASLIILSHSIKVFSSKWNLIRNKLNEILPILAVLSPESLDSGVIEEIEETTEFTTNLAQKCVDLSFSGKLLMQSDLDIITVKLDTHLKSLSELASTEGCSSTGHYAIIVSRPGKTASRDDIVFYVKDLLSRFKIGSPEMKKQAVACFNEVVQEDERCVKIAMEVDGLVHVLVEFLGSKEVGIQEEALKALVIICGFDSYKRVLVSIGVIAPLIRALESGSHLSKELSTRCLIKVTAESENAWSVSAHGGVTALLKIANEHESSDELIILASGVLKNLIGVDEIKRFTLDEGAIQLFVNLITSENEATQISAIEFLQTIGYGDELVAKYILKEGGFRLISNLLDPKSPVSSKTREASIQAIMILCSNSRTLSTQTLTPFNFMDNILYFLQNGDASLQESSLKATFWLSGISDEFKKAMGDAGFIPELIKFISAKSFEVREMASETLLRLVSIPRNRKRLVENDQNVSLLLQSMDSEEGGSGNKKLLLPIIMSLSGCNSGRKKILGSGYLKNIEKLADEQVLDAKKIVRNLSSNRFVRMIRGIWH